MKSLRDEIPLCGERQDGFNFICVSRFHPSLLGFHRACAISLKIIESVYIDWFEDNETKNLTAKLSTANALDEKTEIYVIASDFTWTYIKTHESMCGPYFMKL